MADRDRALASPAARLIRIATLESFTASYQEPRQGPPADLSTELKADRGDRLAGDLATGSGIVEGDVNLDLNLNLIADLCLAVTEEGIRSRARASEALRRGLALSVVELAAIGGEVTSIESFVRSHLERISEIIELMEEQHLLLSSHLQNNQRFDGWVRAGLYRQIQATDRSLSAVQQIDGFVEQIARLADTLNILTINGHTRSTRLGKDGAVFTVISRRLQELSGEVRDANSAIAGVSARLKETLPQMAHTSRDLAQLLDRFSGEQTARVAGFQRQTGEREGWVRDALHRARRRAESIHNAARRISDYLRFQPLMARELAGIGPILDSAWAAEPGDAASDDDIQAGTQMQALADSVSAGIAQAGIAVANVVHRAIRLSEGEIIGASQTLAVIRGEAREHIQELGDIIDRLQNHWRDDTEKRLDHHGLLGPGAATQLRTQCESADRALLLTGEIAAMVHTIAKISMAVRILTLNGQIESSKMGQAGDAFAALSQQLRDLNAEVRSASTAIADLAARLTDSVPAIAESTREVLHLTQRYDDDHRSQVAEFRRLCERNQHRMMNAMVDTRDWGVRILDSTGDILRSLQFQDRMAQDLRDIEWIVRESERILAALFQAMASGRAGTNVSAALAEARQHTGHLTPRLGQRADHPDLSTYHAGDVIF